MQLAEVGAVTAQLTGNFTLTDSLGLEDRVESLALEGPTRIVSDLGRTDGSNLIHPPVG